MSDTLESLRHKLGSAAELQSVVRTMKALAAANIGQYERAVTALADYYRTVELGLAASLRHQRAARAVEPHEPRDGGATGAIVFGSDQGLIGQFNEALAAHAATALAGVPGATTVWAVGERMESQLVDMGRPPAATFSVPSSVSGITPLIGQILVEIEKRRAGEGMPQVLLFHNQPRTGVICEPVTRRLLPLDEKWRHELSQVRWPTFNLPEPVNSPVPTLLALIREYLFVSLFKACAESLASENASRLAAMQRAEKNISEILETLGRNYHRLRQNAIDEELFDVISGFEALIHDTKRAGDRPR